MSNEVITKEMIREGLKQKIIVPFLDEEKTLKCQFGEYWFYFGENKYEGIDPNEIDTEVLVNKIYSVLEEFRKCPDFSDEYLYYYYYLCENKLTNAEILSQMGDMEKFREYIVEEIKKGNMEGTVQWNFYKEDYDEEFQRNNKDLMEYLFGDNEETSIDID